MRPWSALTPAPEPVLLDPTQSRLCLPALRQRQSTICFKKHRVIARNNLLQSIQAGKAFFRRNILIDVSDQLLRIGKPFRKWHLAQPHDAEHREQRIFNEFTCQSLHQFFQCRWHVARIVSSSGVACSILRHFLFLDEPEVIVLLFPSNYLKRQAVRLYGTNALHFPLLLDLHYVHQ